ncbi:hypothetical protein BGX27_008381 [Mortierella sp. AM989]|nr:hypothetical protein BGX27_008381 [Mortierella sp. AM989]
MHIAHYLVGILFYAAMAPAIWIDAYESWVSSALLQNQGQQHAKDGQTNLFDLLTVQTWIGLLLYLWGSFHQNRCHVILANLRKPLTTTVRTKSASDIGSNEASSGIQQEYKVPFGDWFQYLVTPHYSAEMVIYLGFYLMVTSSVSSLSVSTPPAASTMLFVLVWIIANLSIVARESDRWYRSRFGEDYANMTPATEKQQLREQKKMKRAILIPFVY